jgi:cyclopropane-fatty-acyl-phospholipid synthase
MTALAKAIYNETPEPQKPQAKSKQAEVVLDFLQTLMREISPRDFAVRLWDGTTWEAEQGQPTRFTLVINNAGSLKRMLRPPLDISLGEAYAFKDYDVEGDYYAFISRLGTFGHMKLPLSLKLKYLTLPSNMASAASGLAAQLPTGEHSKRRDMAAVQYHYDLSNDFYQLWLDEQMLYSCAYYQSEDQSLEKAQWHKLDHICRKLRLKPGQKMLDIGCGWGALIMHAAEHYGVQAYGITLSKNQAALAAERIKARGLQDKCRVEVRDYRDVEENAFDAVSSIGMAEHVGTAMLPTYFKKMYDVLKVGGTCLNHAISLQPQHIPPDRPTFIKRYIFPDSEMQPIGKTLEVAEEVGFEVRDVESLREHYAMTLREWHRRLEANEKKAKAIVGEERYRMWQMYLAASAWFFDSNRRTIYQSLLFKCTDAPTGLPLTRKDWYA